MTSGSRLKLFLLLWPCIGLSFIEVSTPDFDDGLDLRSAGLPGAGVRRYDLQNDETGVIFHDGFEQPVIEDWGRDIVSTALDVTRSMST